MRDYWLTQYALAAVGWAYLIGSFVALALALWLPKRWQAKLSWGLAVLVLVSIAPFRGYSGYKQRQEAAQEFQLRRAKAQALFEERCKTAGEKIYKTVENVDGVLLMKIRPEKMNFSNQYAMDDPYGTDFGGQAYIRSLLWGKGEDGFLRSNLRVGSTYRYTYARDPNDLKLYRYALGDGDLVDGDVQVVRIPVSDDVPRYGVTYDDISNKEDRDNWIAGSVLKVIDLRTREVMAERVGYMYDSGLGNTSGGRQPWTFAASNACPAFPKLHGTYPHQHGQTRLFVEKVLPSKRSTQGR